MYFFCLWPNYPEYIEEHPGNNPIPRFFCLYLFSLFATLRRGWHNYRPSFSYASSVHDIIAKGLKYASDSSTGICRVGVMYGDGGGTMDFLLYYTVVHPFYKVRS
jgi:hypothetical protein